VVAQGVLRSRLASPIKYTWALLEGSIGSREAPKAKWCMFGTHLHARASGALPIPDPNPAHLEHNSPISSPNRLYNRSANNADLKEKPRVLRHCRFVCEFIMHNEVTRFGSFCVGPKKRDEQFPSPLFASRSHEVRTCVARALMSPTCHPNYRGKQRPKNVFMPAAVTTLALNCSTMTSYMRSEKAPDHPPQVFQDGQAKLALVEIHVHWPAQFGAVSTTRFPQPGTCKQQSAAREISHPPRCIGKATRAIAIASSGKKASTKHLTSLKSRHYLGDRGLSRLQMTANQEPGQNCHAHQPLTHVWKAAGWADWRIATM
jgi:hypothetical protein